MSVSFTTGGDPVAAAACADPAAGAGIPFDAWIADRRARVERALDRTLAPADAHPARLHEAMRYAALGGGKRIRALLAHAAGEALGAPAGALDCAASAVELIHAYSLVHDDLPCMDNDVLRRGRPTVHVVYGEALAMLVGDALQALAFESLAAAADEGVDARTTVSMIAELARASGSVGMAGGQAIDLASVGVALPADALEDMHRRKTGALLAASVRLGGACGQRAGASMPALARYADAVGLAFQIVDDILDVEGDSVTLGKTAGKDADADKPTYVSTLGLEAARALAERLRLQAHEAIAPLGPRAGRLAALADRIVLRRA
ncbi:MAG: polyprenyl synthetase family protein [Burkholderiaceae bacterium]|nr:polyprenyl synthetase family protein [Burkholderiaceae bacterium]